MIRLSLNQHDRHALAQIEEGLADADPRFAARLSAFARLADGGVMPERERIRGPRRPVAARLLRLRRAPGRPSPNWPMYWIAVALTVAVTLAVICAVLVSGNTGTGGACAGWVGLACTRQAPARAPARPGEKRGTASPSPQSTPRALQPPPASSAALRYLPWPQPRRAPPSNPPSRTSSTC